MEELTNEYAVDLLAFRMFCLDGLAPPWWRAAAPRLEKLPALSSPSTSSQWRGSLVALDKVINESFDYAHLRALAVRMGASKRELSGRPQVLAHMLKLAGADPLKSDSVMETMKVLRNLRRTLRSRANDPKRVFITEQILHDFASYEGHFRALAAEAVKALDLVLDYLVPLQGGVGIRRDSAGERDADTREVAQFR